MTTVDLIQTLSGSIRHAGVLRVESVLLTAPAARAIREALLATLVWTTPEGWTAGDIGECRSCLAPVMWATTGDGAKNPVNPDGVTHFATCPDASSWRRRKPVAP